ncbi:MAG: pyruvate kinase [Verrucomicrobiota bacterium]|nr:pyruvate kinase [Verrucomicrobiota bacterium]
MQWVRTKIICTMGPAVEGYEALLQLMREGMSVARINCSHGTVEGHRATIRLLKKVREELQRPLAILVDIKGPEIRVGRFAEGRISLAAGERWKLVSIEQFLGDGEIPMRPAEALRFLAPGMKVLFDDGYILSRVVEIENGFAVVEIENGGILQSNKGINMPDAPLDLPSVTEKDLQDLSFACEEDVDLIAASFVCSSKDVLAIKNILKEKGRPEIGVIAKIESRLGVKNIDSIVQVSDGIMVARGDLGVEIDFSLVPKLQKKMIRKCYLACKPSITATQMLESMIHNPRPTRAEASDVANAIYDSTSAIMLSGETAIGSYPMEAVRYMREIAQVTEEDFPYRAFFEESGEREYHDIASAMAAAAVRTAYVTHARALFVFTTSGMSARLISRLRPEVPILAVTPDEKVYHQLASNWGILPVLAKGCGSAKEAFAAASQVALREGIIAFGDFVVVVTGVPFGQKGSTNLVTVTGVGEIVIRGHAGWGEKVQGKIIHLSSPNSRSPEEFAGRLVVIPYCDRSFLSVLHRAAGIILQNAVDDASSEKYALLIAKTFSLPMISRADRAMHLLSEGEEVTLDPRKGLIYRGTSENFACHLFSL